MYCCFEMMPHCNDIPKITLTQVHLHQNPMHRLLSDGNDINAITDFDKFLTIVIEKSDL